MAQSNSEEDVHMTDSQSQEYGRLKGEYCLVNLYSYYNHLEFVTS